MKSVFRSDTPPLPQSRKIRKPLMEKKRRARINDSLETLKQILLDSKTLFKEGASKKNGQRTAKLEKADILEMTVLYMQHLHQKMMNIQNQKKVSQEFVVQSVADSSSEEIDEDGVTLIPKKLKNGEIIFVLPPPEHQERKQDRNNNVNKENYSVKIEDKVWRPW